MAFGSEQNLVDQPLPPGPQSVPSLWPSAQGKPDSYDLYVVDVETPRYDGLLQLPSASIDGLPAVVRVHAPYSVKIVKWQLRKMCLQGQFPTCPHWDTGNDNEVLFWGNVGLRNPIPTPGGQGLFWHLWGEYRYYLGDPARRYIAPGSPVVTLPTEMFGLTESNFDKSMLRSSGSSQIAEQQKSLSKAGY